MSIDIEELDKITKDAIKRSSPPKLIFRRIKAKDVLNISFSLGRLKSTSTTHQLDLDSSLVQSIASSIASNSSLRKDKTSGKLIIYLNLGGIIGAEFEQIEKPKPSNDLPSSLKEISCTP